MSIDMSAAKGLERPRLEALIEVMFLAATADGEFDEKEKERFEANARELSDGVLGEAAIASLVNDAARALDEAGRGTRLRALREQLPEPELRRLAMALAIQVTAADGIVRTSERELILEAAESLDIDRNDAADLVKQLSG